MKVGKVCKGISIVLFILDFIGSIVLGNIFAISGRYAFSDSSFNWVAFFYVVIIGFIFCLLIYSLGEIIDQLECSNHNTYKLYQLLQKIAVKEERAAELKQSYLTSHIQKENNPFKLYEKMIDDSMQEKVPYHCGKCGQDGPYEGNCPVCGSSIKRYIT